MAIGTTAAILGAAALSAGASAYSGSKAAKAQSKAAGQSADVERYIYDTTREDNAPWRDVGLGALDRLAAMYGLPGVADDRDYAEYVRQNPDLLAGFNGLSPADKLQFRSPADYGRYHYETYGQGENRMLPGRAAPQGGGSLYEEFYKSPDYQFRQKESLKALERSAAARGRLNSGATQAAIVERAGNLASSEYNNYANRLAALAGVGQNANAANQQAGQQYASGMTQAITNAGNARASSYANTGNAINSTIGSLGSAYLYNQGWSGGGGGGTPYTPPGTLFNAGAWT